MATARQSPEIAFKMRPVKAFKNGRHDTSFIGDVLTGRFGAIVIE